MHSTSSICFKCCLINKNITFVYIIVTDYGAVKSCALRLLPKHAYKCLLPVNLRQITLLKVDIRPIAYSGRYIRLKIYLI